MKKMKNSFKWIKFYNLIKLSFQKKKKKKKKNHNNFPFKFNNCIF